MYKCACISANAPSNLISLTCQDTRNISHSANRHSILLSLVKTLSSSVRKDNAIMINRNIPKSVISIFVKAAREMNYSISKTRRNQHVSQQDICSTRQVLSLEIQEEPQSLPLLQFLIFGFMRLTLFCRRLLAFLYMCKTFSICIRLP